MIRNPGDENKQKIVWEEKDLRKSIHCNSKRKFLEIQNQN